jgi:hypothetical protein
MLSCRPQCADLSVQFSSCRRPRGAQIQAALNEPRRVLTVRIESIACRNVPDKVMHSPESEVRTPDRPAEHRMVTVRPGRGDLQGRRLQYRRDEFTGVALRKCAACAHHAKSVQAVGRLQRRELPVCLPLKLIVGSDHSRRGARTLGKETVCRRQCSFRRHRAEREGRPGRSEPRPGSVLIERRIGQPSHDDLYLRQRRSWSPVSGSHARAPPVSRPPPRACPRGLRTRRTASP